jgi:transposase
MFTGLRTQTINALRRHLAEHGVIAPKGTIHVKAQTDAVMDETIDLPEGAQCTSRSSKVLMSKITPLDKMKDAAREAEAALRVQTMPGVGPVTALAIETFAPDLNCFRRGRNFAAWLGLFPKQNSTGGKPRLGNISNMGQRDIRRLLVFGAPLMHVNMHCRAVNGRSSSG